MRARGSLAGRGMGQASRMISEGHSLERTLAAFEAFYGCVLKRSLTA